MQVFWKHWEKEKLVETSNFSFSLSVFYSFGEFFTIFIKFQIVICKLKDGQQTLSVCKLFQFASSFSLQESKISHLGKG